MSKKEEVSLQGGSDLLDRYRSFMQKKPDRVVFGIGIGEDFACKTVSQAFVSRLYNYEMDITDPELAETREEIIAERDKFLKESSSELASGESFEEMLAGAQTYAMEKQNFYQTREHNPNQAGYTDEEMAGLYGSVIGQIDGLLKQTQVECPTE